MGMSVKRESLSVSGFKPRAAAVSEGPAPDRRLGRQHDVARELGVSDKRVATWRSRSARNGFPAPVACWLRGGEGPGLVGRPGARLLWDLDEVAAWYAAYDEAAQRGRTGPYWRNRPEKGLSLSPIGE